MHKTSTVALLAVGAFTGFLGFMAGLSFSMTVEEPSKARDHLSNMLAEMQDEYPLSAEMGTSDLELLYRKRDPKLGGLKDWSILSMKRVGGQAGFSAEVRLTWEHGTTFERFVSHSSRRFAFGVKLSDPVE